MAKKREVHHLGGLPKLRGEMCYGRRAIPVISDITNSIKNRKNKTFAIPAAPAAIPPNPKIAAIIATTRKIIVQRSITYIFK